MERTHCLAGSPTPEELNDPTWVVDADGGLKNVVVWLAPPDRDHFFAFKPDDDDLKPDGKAGWKKTATLRQPHCAYIPHVQALFSHYRDAKGELKETEQELEVTNESKFTHNTNLNESLGVNPALPSGVTEKLPRPRKRLLNKEPIVAGCDIHPWMKAYIWAFDHPFAAFTDEHGKFTIKNAPAGADLKLMVWHEKLEYITGEKGEAIKLDKDKAKTWAKEVEYKE